MKIGKLGSRGKKCKGGKKKFVEEEPRAGFRNTERG